MDASPAIWHGRFVVLATYVAALLGGLVAVRLAAPVDGWTAGVIVHAVATLVVFAQSFRHDNTSLYDAYWSVVPGAVILGWVAWPGLPQEPVRAALIAVVVAAWSVRLTANWASGWTGLDHEDWRYAAYRRHGPASYWAISLFALHGMPTVMVTVGSWSAWRALTTPDAPWGIFDLVATATGLGSVWLSHRADRDLAAFRASRTRPDAVLDQGVWSRSRHPNYLGEIGFWTSLWLFALAAGWHNTPTVVGPVAMVALFRFVSIPLMERRQLARKPGYAQVMARVPMLWPRLVAPPDLHAERD